jgi:hypothetical protein
MADLFDPEESIVNRARLVLGSTGAALVAADCSTISLYVYDLSSDFPTAPVYQLLAAAPSGFLGGTYSDGSITYNFEYTIAATGTFTRYQNHRFLIRYEIQTNAEGELPVEFFADIKLL